MRILFITHYSGMYGANQSMCTLMLELRNKYNVTPYVMLPNSGEICHFLDTHQIEYKIAHYYWWVNSNKGIFQKMLNIRKQFINCLRLNKWVSMWADNEIALVYSNSITINIGSLISKKMQVPHIWHIRESMEQFSFEYSLGNILSKAFLKAAADKYILISDYLIKSYGKILPTEKTEKVYNGISLEQNEVIKNKEASEYFNICIVGVVSEQKNQFDAVKALLELRFNNKNKLQLHLIGTAKGEYLDEIKSFVNKNDLADMVIFHGHQSNVNEFLKGMDLALMTSRDEAFGRVTIEYMLHKIPVIASRSGANEEIVKEGISGELYELYNYKELAEKIELFYNNPAKCKYIGNSGYEYAKQNFSSAQNTANVYAVIESVLKKEKN